MRIRYAAAFMFLALAVLAASPVSAAQLSAGDRAVYVSAFNAVEDDKWPQALATASRAKDPLLAKMILWLDLSRPNSGHRFSEYQSFLAEGADWPNQAGLRAQAELAMPLDLPSDQVLSWFKGHEPLTFAGTMQLARALQTGGNAAKATEVLRRGWVELDATADEEKEFLGKYRSALKAEDHVARLDRLLWDNKSDSARRQMLRVDGAHQALAEARLGLRNGKGNADKLVAKVPAKLQRDPGLIYERARWRRRADSFEAIPELFAQPLKNVARPDLMWRELDDAARRALDRKQAKLAYKLAAQHGAGDGTPFAEGEWLAGWIALRYLKDPKTALAHFTKLHDGVTSPISKARGAYWAGRAAEALKQVDAAKTWYGQAAQWSTTYYGQLAAQRGGHKGPLKLPVSPEPTKQQRADYFKKELAQVVQQLHAIGETDRTRTFLLRLVDLAGTPLEHRLAADLAASLGRNDLTVATAKASRSDGVELVEHLFPLVGVPAGDRPEKALILAIIRQESAFQQDAVSSAGALGLMQLMPATAKAVAKQQGLPYSKGRLTSDTGYNISLGRAYIGDLIDDYGGSYILAIAGYNAGPRRVMEWMGQNRDPRRDGVDVIDWVELIGISETRNYVQRVMENLQVYRQRIGTQMALSIEQDLAR